MRRSPNAFTVHTCIARSSANTENWSTLHTVYKYYAKKATKVANCNFTNVHTITIHYAPPIKLFHFFYFDLR